MRAAERDAWRARTDKLLRGLGEEIDAQLREWGLTPTERETALLLLKGYGHKEIAALQEKSERTVRQEELSNLVDGANSDVRDVGLGPAHDN